MKRDNSQFPAYQWASSLEIMRQFRGNNYKTNRTFIVAAGDQTAFDRLSCGTKALPGFNRSEALIVQRPSGHEELFINLMSPDHRDMQFAFFDYRKTYIPTYVKHLYQSDHAFPKSAAWSSVGLVRAQLIPQPANSTFGALEEFRKGRRGLIDYNGTVPGTLLDVIKALGLPLTGNDYVENLTTGVEMIIGSGLASEKDRPALANCVDGAMVDLIGDSADGASMYKR
jgi:hypothetical protein